PTRADCPSGRGASPHGWSRQVAMTGGAEGPHGSAVVWVVWVVDAGEPDDPDGGSVGDAVSVELPDSGDGVTRVATFGTSDGCSSKLGADAGNDAQPTTRMPAAA